MHTHSLAEYEVPLDRGDMDAVGQLMVSSALKLESIGAEVIICPDNTIHQALDYARSHTTAEWLHIADVVAGEAQRRGHRTVGITGTHWLVRSSVYPAALAAVGIEAVRPDEADIMETARIIMNELVRGEQRPESVRALQGVLARLRAAGCDAVVLGCTELPLVLSDANAPLPTLDSTRLLARAALRASLRASLAWVQRPSTLLRDDKEEKTNDRREWSVGLVSGL